MGVEINFFIMPDDSGFRPPAAKVCDLITRLRAAAYLCDPKSSTFNPSVHTCPRALKDFPDYEGFDWQIENERSVGTLAELEKRLAAHENSDVKLRWPNSNLLKSGLKYPLSKIPDSEDVYYDVEIHLSADTVYYTSEIVDPFEEPIRCACGATLEALDSPGHDFFYSARLLNECPACHTPVNYCTFPAVVRDGWTGDESQVFGGISYRFCVQIECGKMLPDQEATVLPEFRHIIEQCLDCETQVIQNFH